MKCNTIDYFDSYRIGQSVDRHSLSNLENENHASLQRISDAVNMHRLALKSVYNIIHIFPGFFTTIDCRLIVFNKNISIVRITLYFSQIYIGYCSHADFITSTFVNMIIAIILMGTASLFLNWFAVIIYFEISRYVHTISI